MIEMNRIYCENNLETMGRMPEGFVDLTVTSPPYDNLRSYNGFSFDFEKVAKELYRVTKDGGVVVWVVGDSTVNGSETGTSFKQALFFMDCGFNLHDTMIYKKNNPVPLNHNRYEQCFEYMFVVSKGRPKTFTPIMERCVTAGTLNNHKSEKQYEQSYAMKKVDRNIIVNDKKIRQNIFKYTTGLNDETAHNAPMPEQLAADHIHSWSNKGDLVYDPFCGSGTTCKMAHLQKRNWIGSEISQEYVTLAEKRIAPYLQQTTLDL